MSEGTHLRGLEGNNPLAFLAALGVQVVFDHEEFQPRLWWSDDIIPHAIVDGSVDVEHLVEKALQAFTLWNNSWALNPGFGTKVDDTAKFDRGELREYLGNTRTPEPGNRLAWSLVAEASLDRAGKVAKPTDLYFTAGQLKFLKIARDIFTQVDGDAVLEALEGPWSYSSTLSSLGWDTTDDRSYALAPANPAKEKKLTNPGAEALAILGLSRHPVFAGRDERGRDRTLTLGCEGPWRRDGSYTWPIWIRPATPNAVRSLLAQATGGNKELQRRSKWYSGWGVSLIMRSAIRRSDQGGYGTFGPPVIIWSG